MRLEPASSRRRAQSFTQGEAEEVVPQAAKDVKAQLDDMELFALIAGALVVAHRVLLHVNDAMAHKDL